MSSETPYVVLFDWDGTLIDSGDLLLKCWHRVTTKVLGAPFPVTEQDRVKFLSMRGADSFPLLSDDPDVVQALDHGFTDAYLELAPAEVRLQTGARDLVDTLRARGFAIAVVTSKTTTRFLCDMEVCGLRHCFDAVVTGDDVTRGKPDPEGILLALRAMGASADRAMMVGDGPVDIRAGRAAGVSTVGISHGLHSAQELRDAHPDELVDSLAAVSELLLRM